MNKALKKIPMFFHEYKGQRIPDVDIESYRLTIAGAVTHPLALSLKELEESLPFIEAERRFYCVNGWSLAARWGGFELAKTLGLAAPLPEATYLRATSLGGYEDTSRVQDLIDGRAMLV